MSAKTEFYGNSNQVMKNAIDRIIVTLHEKQKRENFKTLLLSGCGPKSGTTTISIDLAIALADSGFKTLLVDCDLRKDNKLKDSNQNTGLGLTDYLSGGMKTEDILCETNHKLLTFINSGSNADGPIRLLCSKQMEILFQEITNSYEFIIFDFPSVNIVPDAEVLFPYVDGISYIAALNHTTKGQLKEARIKVKSYQEKCMGLIINRVGVEEYKKYIRDFDYFEQKKQIQISPTDKKKKISHTGREVTHAAN